MHLCRGRPSAPPAVFRKEVTMEYEEAKKLLVETLTKKLKNKSKFYFNDLSKILGMKPREAKKIINKLVQDEVLEYWSSGSTSMYGMPGTGKQAGAEHED